MNDCQKIVSSYLNPAPVYECELVNIKNQNDEDDNILLFHIESDNKGKYIIKN